MLPFVEMIQSSDSTVERIVSTAQLGDDFGCRMPLVRIFLLRWMQTLVHKVRRCEVVAPIGCILEFWSMHLRVDEVEKSWMGQL